VSTKRDFWTLLRLTSQVLLLGLVLGASTEIHAQTARQIRVEELRLNPRAHENELRTVEGIVERFVEEGTATTQSYYLEDDFGHLIRIVTSNERPPRGTRVTVTGIVNLDRAGDPFIVDQGGGIRRAQTDTDEPAPPPDDDMDGVPNAEDQCPNSAPGEFVGLDGCPEDDDEDGVSNAEDQCPNTAPGETVDACGCAVTCRSVHAAVGRVHPILRSAAFSDSAFGRVGESGGVCNATSCHPRY